MTWCVKCGCAVGEREHKPNHRSDQQDGICGCECKEFTDVNPNQYDYGKVYRDAAARHSGAAGQAQNPFTSNYQRTESEIRMEGKLDRIIALLEELKARG